MLRRDSIPLAFTLVEVMVATALFTALFAMAYASFSGLQRNSLFLTAWSDVRVNQVRLLDTLSFDLRNARTVTVGAGSTWPLTLAGIPQLYSSYQRSGSRAGDPAVDAVKVEAAPVVGKHQVAYPLGTMSVVYTSSTESNGTQTITRSVTWTEGGKQTAGRTMATFPSGLTATFRNAAGGTLSSSDTAVQITLTSTPRNVVTGGSATAISTLSNLVFLRDATAK